MTQQQMQLFARVSYEQNVFLCMCERDRERNKQCESVCQLVDRMMMAWMGKLFDEGMGVFVCAWRLGMQLEAGTPHPAAQSEVHLGLLSKQSCAVLHDCSCKQVCVLLVETERQKGNNIYHGADIPIIMFTNLTTACCTLANK